MTRCSQGEMTNNLTYAEQILPQQTLTLIVDWYTVKAMLREEQNFTAVTSRLCCASDKISSLLFKSQTFAVRSKYNSGFIYNELISIYISDFVLMKSHH